MIQPKVHELSETVKSNLIALALMQAGLREHREAVERYRDRIEEEMPGGSQLAANGELMVKLIEEHNGRCARA